jgi:hypothetical protein
MRFDEIVKTILESSDYRGEHQAPTKGEGSAPLWNLTEIYPDDIYSSKAAQYYGDASPLDRQAISVMHSYRNRPNAKVVIYRAVPVDSKLKQIQNELKEVNEEIYFAERKPFRKVNWSKMVELGIGIESVDEYIALLYKKSEELENLLKSKTKMTINTGDWITTVRQYAVDHGEGALNGNYKILKKTVFARDVFTDANSIFEFGYDPQPAAKK